MLARNPAPSVDAVHFRLKTERGPASSLECVECGGTAAEWSYLGGAPDEAVSEHGPYSADLSLYVPRCVSCHRLFDSPRHPRRSA